MSKKNILIIDKDIDSLNFLKAYLKEMGYSSKISIAQSGGDAWSELQKENYQIVISAWDLYEVSGLDLLIIFRRDARFQEIPFFLTKSNFSQKDVIRAGQAGVSGLFVSPCDPRTLWEKIENTLNKSVCNEEKQLASGFELIEKGEYEKALEVLYALLKEGEKAEIYYNIGYVKTAQKKYCEAVEAFKTATELDKLYAKAYRALGMVCSKMGDDDKAEDYLQKAADIYLNSERDSEAEDVLKELININPNTKNAYNSLGVIYRKKGEFEKSLYFYKKALKVQPDGDYIYYNIGKLYILLREFEAAKVYLEKAYEINSDGYEDLPELLERLERAV